MPVVNYPRPTEAISAVYERISEYFLISHPVKDLPLRIRPAVIFATAAWILLLGVLGMAPLPDLPVNDKALHFFGLGFATFLLYFIIEVPEGPAKRLWYIRRAPLLFTLFTSFFIGGIISEFIQSALPWKEFQSGDIVANLLGASLFLYLANFAYRRSRRRNEISSLYQPLSSSTYRDAQGRTHNFDGASNEQPPLRLGRGGAQPARHGSNPWDEGDDSEAGSPRLDGGFGDLGPGRGQEMFGIGDEDDVEAQRAPRK